MSFLVSSSSSAALALLQNVAIYPTPLPLLPLASSRFILAPLGRHSCSPRPAGIARPLQVASLATAATQATKLTQNQPPAAVPHTSYPIPSIPEELAKAAPTIDVAAWTRNNYKLYSGDSSFLAGPTEKTQALWKQCEDLLLQESKNNGCLDVDQHTPSLITSHRPGYINKENEVIVGLQTDAPLKRAIKPFGGINMVNNALKAYKYPIDPKVTEIFTKYRKTHNEGVFDMYTPEMLRARSNHLMTGLPDGYGRGRLIGDYRRVALYGVDKLIEVKTLDKLGIPAAGDNMSDSVLRLREEIADQIKALKALKAMALEYGYDLSKPAANAKEAIQWTYFAYLAAVKEQDGAAMSLGRVDTFFDVFIEKDLAEGKITEEEAQELIDQFVIKLRLVRHLRTPEYNDLFAGDPTWVTAVIGGLGDDCKPLVTKTSYRILNTLYNLGPAPEPNMTVLWHNELPENFKTFCSRVSIDTSSVQYESDKLMSNQFNSTDYGIACCVSGMNIGKDMQFFGARVNLAKLMLYVLNHGRDEITGKQVSPDFGSIPDGPIDYDLFWERYSTAMDWMAGLYVNTMNAIHYSHDKYSYEAVQMALHDTHVRRFMAFGIAGLSIVADSLSAIKHAKVTPIRDPKTGLTVDFKIEGQFPKYGNDDDRVDQFARKIPSIFHQKLQQYPTYRGAEHTLSVLTITSNVVYGKATGSTPDGRKQGEPFAPGANPMHGREDCGALASLSSVSKIPYTHCLDGISNTFSIVPSALGKLPKEAEQNLGALLDGYFDKGGFHLNVNVLKREMLEDAMVHPEKYPNLTIRVSGYAVHFTKLTPQQQREVLARTFHDTF
ncbi:pyruvate formate lyase [Polychytrium aggregatum]|uniref:pyruvate formate lyase n=1 Tax=Polychytrium aggregatum TaxID=110093 RepID=UPI0022FE7011|nr:pyruvate formate lyase [Polychytrium aggregatum]KAI9202976.1 pyruvate formate lyase [Polychytrium aggregatum]